MPTKLYARQKNYRDAQEKLGSVRAKLTGQSERIEELRQELAIREKAERAKQADAVLEGKDPALRDSKEVLDLRDEISRREKLYEEIKARWSVAGSEERAAHRSVLDEELAVAIDEEKKSRERHAELTAELKKLEGEIDKTLRKQSELNQDITRELKVESDGWIEWCGTLEEFQALIENPVCSLDPEAARQIVEEWKKGYEEILYPGNRELQRVVVQHITRAHVWWSVDTGLPVLLQSTQHDWAHQFALDRTRIRQARRLGQLAPIPISFSRITMDIAVPTIPAEVAD